MTGESRRWWAGFPATADTGPPLATPNWPTGTLVPAAERTGAIIAAAMQ